MARDLLFKRGLKSPAPFVRNQLVLSTSYRPTNYGSQTNIGYTTWYIHPCLHIPVSLTSQKMRNETTIYHDIRTKDWSNPSIADQVEGGCFRRYALISNSASKTGGMLKVLPILPRRMRYRLLLRRPSRKLVRIRTGVIVVLQ